jgi:hypothetical protein
MTRITAAAPEALIYESNQLAMCLAFSVADGLTYTGLNWQDADGNLYAAASWEASDAWVENVSQPLVRPAWDVDEVIDMDAAAAAQVALVFSTEPVLAVPDKLTALSGPDAVAALGLMGLTPVEIADNVD